MSESRAVPSGKVYQQLFGAQVQLSRSLLAGRRDTRTDCLSAEDSNTHCSTTSRGQQLDDADEVDDVCRLPDSMAVSRPSSDFLERLAEKKSRKHKEALTQLDKELSEITQVYETRVRAVSEELRSSLQNVDLFLNNLKDRMKNLEHLENVTLQDVCSLWEEVEEAVKIKKTRIMELNQKLTEAESKRTDQIRVVLRKYCPLLEKISYLPPFDVHRLIHNEATMLNQSLLANRRSVARLLLLLQEQNLQQEALLRLHWEDCLSRWRSARVREITDCYRELCSSDEDQEQVLVQKAAQKMKQTQQELMEKRRDIVSNMCSLVPPLCSVSLVSDWFNQLMAVNEQIDSVHADHLNQLCGCYEQRWQDRLTEVERCKEALSALQLPEDEVKYVVGSKLLPLTGQSQNLVEERLAGFNVCCESLACRAVSLSRCVFNLIRGAALLWETHNRRLKMREEELQQQMDDLRGSQQHHIQRKKVSLDVLLGALRQEGSESALKTSLDKAVVFLQEVQQSCRQQVSDQCQLLDRLPSLLLEELLSYSSSLSSFFRLNHTYRPSPEDLQKLHPSLSSTSDQLNSGGAETEKPEEMTENHPISCQTDTDLAQPSDDWLTEAESSLKDLCDIRSDVTFTSSSGVAYTGPAFSCPAPDLPDDQQQETHLTLFPVELLTHKLISVRTLFLENLEQHFRDVLSAAVIMVTHREEVLHSEEELHLKQLNHQHIQTHIYEPRLAELQLHKQRVDAHFDGVSDVLASCKLELKDLQTSIKEKNEKFSATVSNMDDNIMTADNSQRLEAVSSALQDCLDKHIRDTQDCQTSFRQTVQIRLEEVRHRTAQLLMSFRLFSEGGDFSPQEVKMFQRKVKEKTKQIRVAEKSIYSELEGFESKSLLQVKEVSGRFEETLSVLKTEVMFTEKIKKIISSTRVSIKAEAASSNQQQDALSSRLEDLRRLMEDTQVSPDQVSSFLSSVSDDFKKRSQYLEFSWVHTLQESLSPRPKSRKKVRSAPPPGLLQPSRKGVYILNDPVVGVIKFLNRFSMIQEDGTEEVEKEERGRTASGQSSVRRLQQRCTSSVSNLSVGRGSKSIRSDRRLQVFGPKPDPEQTSHSLSSAVNGVLWKANDVILPVAEDFYLSKRGSRFLLVPDSLNQWAESMQQRLLGYQDQARKLLSTSRDELMIQLSFLAELLKLLPKVLITNHERQQVAKLREEVGGVRMKLEDTLTAGEKEKGENVRQLRASLRDDELQTTSGGEELRQQQLHSAICSTHLELQECVRVRGEEFVTSLASLTEKLLHQLDDLLTASDTEAQASQQHPEESSLTTETGEEPGPKLCTVSRTFSGIPYPMPPADLPPGVTIATTASITTTRCSSVHEAVIELRDAAVKRFEQLLRSESSRSDDDKGRRLSELQSWRQQTPT
ncbi:coiled-coil domain-containing protein 180 isoform X2 [Notolabrus celidotus]|uniref:coiled-coil domain-containing protein 180 isoform X2 n=1 Tax=Notolabrus celidotus TaxID=1203425 RepID=UPI00148F8A92|nr:coiled-coil domain-containing protein 180 isoform X2 [Notolabrus celidotus]